MFSNLKQYKTTSTPYQPFSKTITISDYPFEEKMVKSFNSYSKKKHYDITKLRDEKFEDAKREALEEMVESFSDYQSFFCMRKGECTNFGVGNKANVFRFTANRNEETKMIFIMIHFKYEPPSVLDEEETEELLNAPKHKRKPKLVAEEEADDVLA